MVRSYQLDVWRLCAHLVDAQSADDLTQEAFVRAWRALPAFRGDSSVRTWLLSIARRTCVDEVRQRVATRRRDGELALLASSAPSGAEPASSVVPVMLVDQLDADRRAAFVTTQLLGLSYAEAAEVLDCPIGTIRSRVARARDDLIALSELGAAPRRSRAVRDR